MASAEKEVAEAERIARLNEQYGLALREMDSANWHEARRLLENVHKSQTGFLATEKLLRKVENEILKEEGQRKQKEEIDTLYEQAHGLLRSKKWRKALDKLEEIRAIDNRFSDPDQIAEKVQTELEHEEQEIQRQNHVAAEYAEAVRLLKEEKYEEAINKWQEIKELDPTYPDRQGVQRTARKKLARNGGILKRRIQLPHVQRKFIGIGSAAALALLVTVAGFVFMNQPAMLPACSYATGIQDPLFLESKLHSFPIFVDGKITYPTEWKNGGCHQFNLILYEPGQGCTGNSSITSTWLITNDNERLYFLVRIPKVVFTPTGISLNYFYPYPGAGGWQHSDSAGIDHGKPLDQFGWNDVNWRDDISDGGTMDTLAKATRDDQYYWYEFSKPLDSSDKHDWKWTQGNRIGTAISGDLMIGTWGISPTGSTTNYFCRYIQLKLEE